MNGQEKSELALGGISIEYSDCFDIVKDATYVLDKMNHYTWEKIPIDEVTKMFSDLGDKRKQEYLEKIVLDALERGQEMKQRVSDVIKKAGFNVTEGRIRKIVYWNRLERHEHGGVGLYLLQNEEGE